MTDGPALISLVATGLAAIGIASAAGLKVWTGWLELKRLELGEEGGDRRRPRPRGELGVLRERVRRLEAIATGIDP